VGSPCLRFISAELRRQMQNLSRGRPVAAGAIIFPHSKRPPPSLSCSLFRRLFPLRQNPLCETVLRARAPEISYAVGELSNV